MLHRLTKHYFCILVNEYITNLLDNNFNSFVIIVKFNKINSAVLILQINFFCIGFNFFEHYRFSENIVNRYGFSIGIQQIKNSFFGTGKSCKVWIFSTEILLFAFIFPTQISDSPTFLFT